MVFSFDLVSIMDVVAKSIIDVVAMMLYHSAGSTATTSMIDFLSRFLNKHLFSSKKRIAVSTTQFVCHSVVNHLPLSILSSIQSSKMHLNISSHKQQ